MLALGKDASKLALLACGRGRAGGPARLGEARRGSSSSPPAASQHSSSLDGSLSGMLWACCTASPTLWEGLQGQGGPARARLRAQYYHDYLLSNRAADSGLAQRAARRQAAPRPSDSICCLASLAATASGGLRRPPRFASAAYDCGTHVGSPPASPAAGPHSAPLVGGVPRRLRSTGCLAQTAADAARGRGRRCSAAPPAASPCRSASSRETPKTSQSSSSRAQAEAGGPPRAGWRGGGRPAGGQTARSCGEARACRCGGEARSASELGLLRPVPSAAAARGCSRGEAPGRPPQRPPPEAATMDGAPLWVRFRVTNSTTTCEGPPRM